MPCAGPQGVTGDTDPLPPENSQKYRVLLRNTGLDPLKTTRLPSQHSMLDNHLLSGVQEVTGLPHVKYYI